MRECLLDLEHLGGGPAGLVQQVLDRHARQRMRAEPSHRGLRGRLPLKLTFDLLLVADVEQHAVPQRAAVLAAEQA